MTDFASGAVTALTGAAFVVWLAMLAIRRKWGRK